jgi:hypothetical protein
MSFSAFKAADTKLFQAATRQFGSFKRALEAAGINA